MPAVVGMSAMDAVYLLRKIFTPIANHTLGASLLTVRPATSGATNSRGVTGGVYKTRERIHRDIADSRLLAIPTSCTRVAEYNPN